MLNLEAPQVFLRYNFPTSTFPVSSSPQEPTNVGARDGRIALPRAANCGEVMKARILVVEGKRADRPSFVAGLMRKGYQVESVPNGSAALGRLDSYQPHLVVIDAASMRTSGKRICQSMRAHAPNIPIALILSPEQVSLYQNESLAEVMLVLPFTLQKLINRIRSLLPTETKDIIRVGVIQLDPVQRWVRVGSRQTSLTPRLVTLLRILMEHPGEVIERETLFRQAWDTAYTEDTRTLDVHISWLRRALEHDYRHPRLIKTIRGVGYRLDPEEER
ncbi:MAG TPA: DNA-binding response regulator [Anaerolinea thermolimosa]|uniref:DNA-binding response regulator n=2 Tax=Anaerolinea thermolimosa TaxID=229919 RepID=A0A0M9U2U3_9CHLR|nr:response regulators consisting of a CheY-like receiver domain and a winged-helix DNA-binding domain [Anaerolinea thermolimosa]GAP08859.1 response regulators consisting of a CheY-like receiver domain and a winged-helix DNA-binding domain [Anaerolinea thermolimosa]HCE17483.1 DNA-binding response regulator [Anaerolinea thermolimosa]